jgi:hypothetical protein
MMGNGESFKEVERLLNGSKDCTSYKICDCKDITNQIKYNKRKYIENS